MSDPTYPGPLRGERPAIELSNTRYASRAGPVDGLDHPGEASAFLTAVLPEHAGHPPDHAALIELRDAIGLTLRAALDGSPLDPRACAILNRCAAASPTAPRLATDRGGPPQAHVEHLGPPRDRALAAFAADAIALVTGPDRLTLRACHAPGCVLLFGKDHPRRAWCSTACGNRARQARYAARHRRAS